MSSSHPSRHVPKLQIRVDAERNPQQVLSSKDLHEMR